MDEQAILSLLEQWGKLRNFTLSRDAALPPSSLLGGYFRQPRPPLAGYTDA